MLRYVTLVSPVLKRSPSQEINFVTRRLAHPSGWLLKVDPSYLADMMKLTVLRAFTPTVLSGHLASEKSDVYAYAIVLWEILTRKAPFSDVKSFEEFLDGTS